MIDIRTKSDRRGWLSVLEEGEEVDFRIRRVYVVNIVKPRGGHAHPRTNQLIMCTHGEVRVTLKTPGTRSVYILPNSKSGLRVSPLTWIEVEPLLENSVYIVLTDTLYNEADTIRNWREYCDLFKGN